MYNKELFDYISRGNIEKSLYATCIFLIENSKIEVLEETLISICSHIGTFIQIRDISKLNDIIISTRNIIENDNNTISDYLILITQMCILCNTYISVLVSKTGVLPLSKLREKVIDVFNSDGKLSSNGIMKFEMIIPPPDSDAYLLSLKIISSFIRIIRVIEDIASENKDGIDLISIKFKNCFDYIIRKKYSIQTRLNPDDCDPIYFLWGFIEILFQHEEFIHSYYWLFSNNYKKSLKPQRIGIIYGCAVAIIYSYKKSISTSWNQNELNVIHKTKEISIELIKQVRQDLKSKNLLIEVPLEKPSKTNKNNKSKNKEIDDYNERDKSKLDGINYLETYIPKIEIIDKSNDSYLPTPTLFQEEIKTII